MDYVLTLSRCKFGCELFPFSQRWAGLRAVFCPAYDDALTPMFLFLFGVFDLVDVVRGRELYRRDLLFASYLSLQ